MHEQETYARPNIDGQQYGVPDIVEEGIQKQAARVAYKANRPDLIEDLEQEERVRAWKEAENGETNPRHLLADTKQAISGVMRAGRDVDGRAWPTYERTKVYQITSLAYPIDEKGTTHGETIIDDRLTVEEQALGLVILAAIFAVLNTEEQRVLSGKLEGYTHQEIVYEYQMGNKDTVKRRARRIKEKTATYLER